MTTKRVKSLKELWLMYEKIVLAAGSSTEERLATRRIFYAGALGIFCEIASVAELPEDLAVARMDGWQQELDDYATELMAAASATAPVGPTS
mgnify:FL=1